MSSPIYLLPQELIDKIVDQVYVDARRGCTKMMSNCSLVSRSFSLRARQRQLQHFSRIILPSDPSPTIESRMPLLCDIIASNPSISSHVKALELVNPSQTSSIWDYPQTLYIMEAITPLQKLYVDGGDCAFMAECDLEDSTVHHVEHFFKQFIFPFITYLHISYIPDVPVHIVEDCIALQELIMMHVKFAPLSSCTTSRVHDNGAGPKLLRFISYSCADGVPVLLRKESPMDFSTVKNLEVQSNHSIQTNQLLIDACARSLQKVRFADNESAALNLAWRMAFREFPTLKDCTNLVKLACTSGATRFHHMCDLLSTIPLGAPVEEIKIDFIEWEGTNLLDAPWERFNEQIMRLVPLASTTLHVTLRLELWYASLPERSVWNEYKISILESLNGKLSSLNSVPFIGVHIICVPMENNAPSPGW